MTDSETLSPQQQQRLKRKIPFWVPALGLIILIIGALLVRQFLFKKTITPQYQTTQAERGTLVLALSGSGQVSTTNSTTLTTQASGVVAKVFVQEGQTVKTGTPIAKIELDLLSQQKAQQALANYQNAKNQVAAAQANLYTLQSKLFFNNQKFMNGAVVQGLAKEDPNYIQQDADWLAAESTYKTQQAVINQAQLSANEAWLSYQQTSDTIFAPISGKITGLSIQLGSVITAQVSTSTTNSSTKLANITTDAVPTVKINLTEIDVPKIKIGDKATVTLDALPDKSFVGKVISVDTVGQVSSGVTTYPVLVQLNESVADILPNMAATANIILDTKTDVISVPLAAVQNQTTSPTVRVMKNGKVESVTVSLGLATDTDVEIINGIQEGETIVTGVSSTEKAPVTQTTSVFSSFGNNRGGAGSFGGGANRARN